MKKAFVLIFSCFLLFLPLHIVRTHYAKNEETNKKDTKLKKKRNVKTFNKKLTNKSFLQVQHTVATRSVPPPPCLGDDCFCQNYYDLTLILDESASIGSKNWKNHVIPFTDKIIKDLTISKNEVHVGILLFSSKNRDYVTYGDELRYQKDELLKKVEKLKKDYYCGGGTKILGALKYSLENYTKHKNIRYDAPKVTILFTDGNENSASNKQLLEMGLTYRRERVKLLVLGVAAAEDNKLKLIAGGNTTPLSHIFFTNTSDTLFNNPHSVLITNGQTTFGAQPTNIFNLFSLAVETPTTNNLTFSFLYNNAISCNPFSDS